MLKCKKYHVKIENGSCEIKECEYRKTCMGENESVVASIETAISVENKETVISNENKESKSVPELNLVEPESSEIKESVVKSVCEPIISEIDIDKNTDNLIMGDALKHSKELKEKKYDEALLNKEILPIELSKILRVNQFHVKPAPNGTDVSVDVFFNVKIELVMSKSMAIALSKALHRNNLG